MQFSVFIASLLAAASVTSAVPAYLKRQDALLCTGLDSNPQCCATDVLGVADLNCAPPPTIPTSVPDFINICAAIGQQAECCAIPILGQALICESPE